MTFRFIQVNRAKCTHCGDVVLSDIEAAATEFECGCGKLKISGGATSLVRTGRQGHDFVEMSILNFNGCPAVKEEIQDPPVQQGQILDHINKNVRK